MSRIGEITVGQKRKIQGWVEEEKSRLGKREKIMVRYKRKNQGWVKEEKSR